MSNKTLHPDERSLPAHLAAAIDREGLLAPGQRVLLAVSGGRDSVALLAAMVTLAEEPGRHYALCVAHLDHQLRDDSHQDAAFVEQLAREHSLPCVVARIDIAKQARERQLSIETAARQARYEFLADAAAQLGCPTIATAHHRDDQVETVLHRLLRGTHLRGLGGMPAKRRLQTGALLIRPLLDCSRDTIATYADQCSLTWRDDPTNTENAYTRNAIRNDLLPYLAERFNPNVEEAILRLAAAAGEGDAYLASQAGDVLDEAILACPQDGLALDCAALAASEPVLQRYALRLAVESLGAPLRKLTAGHLAALAEMLTPDGPAALDLPAGLRARRCDGVLHLGPAPKADEAIDPTPIPLLRTGQANTPLGPLTTAEAPFDADAFDAYCRRNNPREQWLDAAAISGELHLRPWRAGDRFTPLGAPGSQSVSDFLTNLKLPATQRRQAMCLCDEAGIVCLLPIRVADRAKIAPTTQHIIRVELTAIS